MEIVQGSVGSEGSYDVKVEAGKVVVAVAYQGADMGAKLEVSMSARAYLDKLAAAIPGGIDDVILKALESAMGL